MRGRATHGAKSSKSFHTSKVFLAHSFFNLYELKRSVLLVNEFCIICQKCGDCSAMPLRNVRLRLISSTNRFKYIENVSCYHAQSPTPPSHSSSQSSFDRRGSQWHHECFMQNGGGAGTSCRQFLIIMIFVIINISIGIIIVVITSSSSSSSSSWDIVIIIVITIVISLFRCNHHHQPTCHYHLNNCKLSYFLVSCCDCHNDFN